MVAFFWWFDESAVNRLVATLRSDLARARRADPRGPLLTLQAAQVTCCADRHLCALSLVHGGAVPSAESRVETIQIAVGGAEEGATGTFLKGRQPVDQTGLLQVVLVEVEGAMSAGGMSGEAMTVGHDTDRPRAPRR